MIEERLLALAESLKEIHEKFWFKFQGEPEYGFCFTCHYPNQGRPDQTHRCHCVDHAVMAAIRRYWAEEEDKK